MLSEVAWVKLSWVLGHEDWAKDKEQSKKKCLLTFLMNLTNS
jgi:hypothetical protein